MTIEGAAGHRNGDGIGYRRDQLHRIEATRGALGPKQFLWLLNADGWNQAVRHGMTVWVNRPKVVYRLRPSGMRSLDAGIAMLWGGSGSAV